MDILWGVGLKITMGKYKHNIIPVKIHAGSGAFFKLKITVEKKTDRFHHILWNFISALFYTIPLKNCILFCSTKPILLIFPLLLFCHQLVSDSLRPHGLQHDKLPCPSLSPGVVSNSCPLSQWCHPTISSSVTSLSPCPQSFPASGSFPISQFFTSSGQSIGASASVSILPMNIWGWFPLGLTGLISLQSEGLSRVFSSITVQKH